ncbi:morphogenic membrane protein MmpB [Streptomyces sp. NPDC049040]
MLWQDDQRDEPPEEMRHAQVMLRRAMVVVAVVAGVVMAFAGWHL